MRLSDINMNSFNKYLFTGLIFFVSTVAIAQVPTKDLDYFINNAQTSSPILKDLQNQQKSLRIDSMLIKAVGGLQVSALGSGMYAPVIRGYGYDEVITNGQALEGLLTVNYGLLNNKRINNQLQGIKIQKDSLSYASKNSFYDLERSIIEQYLIAYSSQEQVDFNKELVVLLEKEEAVLKQLTRKNNYKQAEYLTFLVTLQQQQLATKQIELQAQNDFATLAYLSGIADTTKTKLIEPKLNNKSAYVGDSFFLQRFEIDSLRNSNLRRGIDLNYKPKFGIYANGGYSSSLVFQPYKNFGASAGFSLSIPIYDGHQKKMQMDKLELSRNTIATYKDFFIRQKSQQLNLILQQLSQTDALFDKIKEQIRFSKGLIEVDSKLLHTGDLRITDFIIAINNYMSAQNLFRQTTINRLKLINQYNYWNK